MAIYHCTVKPIGRRSGMSAVAAAAYRTGSLLLDERTGEWKDYTRRDGVLFSEIVLPEGVDAKFKDRATLWNEAERAETRLNARTAREIIIAIPHELSEADRLTLVRDFADTVCRRYGVGIEFSIHAPDRQGDDRNHHCHLMMTTRRLTAEGFGEKTRELDDRRLGRMEIHMLRLLWREHANDALERAGFDERIDERSYEDRELDIEPTLHLGPYASALERAGRGTRLGDHNREAEADPLGRVLEQMTRTRSVFTSADLAVALFNRELDPALRHQLLDDPEVIRLHDRASGQALDLYTTRTIRAQETRIMAAASGMAMDRGHLVAEDAIAAAADARDLSIEQELALRHAVQAGGVKIIEGRAGTGKSHTIHAIREAFERDGYRVIGLAPTNVVVADLAKGGFAEARTAHSLLWYADYEKESGRARPEASLDASTVLILDEAAMLDTRTLDRVVALAHGAGAKLILVGDDRQLASVERGGMFGVLRDELGSAELKEVRRQHEDWQREASEALAGGRFLEAVKAYDERGFVHWSRDQAQAEDALIAQWRADTEDGIGERFVFAYTNADVDRLNAALQAEQIERGRVTDLAPIATDRGELLIGQGDRVQFRATDKQRGIANGMLGTVAEIEDGRLRITLDDGQEIEVDTVEYGGVDLGYAGTIYKGQGRTLDQAYVLHTQHWRDQASYVAMTRAREATHVFVAEDAARDVEELARQMGRRSSLGASLQYATEDEFENTNQGDAMTSRNDEALRRAQQQAEQEEQERQQAAEAERQQEQARTADAERIEAIKRQAIEAEQEQAEIDAREAAELAISDALAGADAEHVEAAWMARHAELEEDDTPNSATRRYLNAHAEHYDPENSYSSLAIIAHEEWKMFRAEQDELARQIDAEQDPDRRGMLELRRLLENAEYRAGVEGRMEGIYGDWSVRDSEAYRQSYLDTQKRREGFEEVAEKARQLWQERGLDNATLYPALDDDMQAEYDRAARQQADMEAEELVTEEQAAAIDTIEATPLEADAHEAEPVEIEQEETTPAIEIEEHDIDLETAARDIQRQAEDERQAPDHTEQEAEALEEPDAVERMQAEHEEFAAEMEAARRAKEQEERARTPSEPERTNTGDGTTGGKQEQEREDVPAGLYKPMSDEERERRDREDQERKERERERGEDDDYEL